MSLAGGRGLSNTVVTCLSEARNAFEGVITGTRNGKKGTRLAAVTKAEAVMKKMLPEANHAAMITALTPYFDSAEHHSPVGDHGDGVNGDMYGNQADGAGGEYGNNGPAGHDEYGGNNPESVDAAVGVSYYPGRAVHLVAFLWGACRMDAQHLKLSVATPLSLLPRSG